MKAQIKEYILKNLGNARATVKNEFENHYKDYSSRDEDILYDLMFSIEEEIEKVKEISVT